MSNPCLLSRSARGTTMFTNRSCFASSASNGRQVSTGSLVAAGPISRTNRGMPPQASGMPRSPDSRGEISGSTCAKSPRSNPLQVVSGKGRCRCHGGRVPFSISVCDNSARNTLSIVGCSLPNDAVSATIEFSRVFSGKSRHDQVPR